MIRTFIFTAAIICLGASSAMASSKVPCEYKAKEGERVVKNDKGCVMVKIQKQLPKSFTRGPTVHNPGFKLSPWNR